MSYTLAGDAEGHVDCDMWKEIEDPALVTFVLRAAGYDVKPGMSLSDGLAAIAMGQTLQPREWTDEELAAVDAEYGEPTA